MGNRLLLAAWAVAFAFSLTQAWQVILKKVHETSQPGARVRAYGDGQGGRPLPADRIGIHRCAMRYRLVYVPAFNQNRKSFASTVCTGMIGPMNREVSMKRILVVICATLLAAQAASASCEKLYAQKVRKIDRAQSIWTGNEASVLGWTTGGGIAAVAGASTGVVIAGMFGGALALPLTVYVATEISEHRYAYAAALINNSYHVADGVSEDLEKEAKRLSEKLGKEVDPKELAAKIVDLDGKNAFCIDGSATGLRKFRKIVAFNYDNP